MLVRGGMRGFWCGIVGPLCNRGMLWVFAAVGGCRGERGVSVDAKLSGAEPLRAFL